MSKRTGNRDTRAAKHRRRRHAAWLSAKMKIRAGILAFVAMAGGHGRAAAIALGVKFKEAKAPRMPVDHPLSVRLRQMEASAKTLREKAAYKRGLGNHPGHAIDAEAYEADLQAVLVHRESVVEAMQRWAATHHSWKRNPVAE